jgi:hypothetical protein
MRLTGAFRSIKTSQAAIKKRFSFIRHLERAFFSVSRSPKRREEDFFMAAERFSVKCMMHDHSQVSGQTSLQTGEEGRKKPKHKKRTHIWCYFFGVDDVSRLRGPGT